MYNNMTLWCTTHTHTPAGPFDLSASAHLLNPLAACVGDLLTLIAESMKVECIMQVSFVCLDTIHAAAKLSLCYVFILMVIDFCTVDHSIPIHSCLYSRHFHRAIGYSLAIYCTTSGHYY